MKVIMEICGPHKAERLGKLIDYKLFKKDKKCIYTVTE
jgi:hypothetical protein